MAYPWNAGDTLNAADLNDYAGLVFIKSVAVGAGVSSVGVSGLTGFNVYQFVFDRVDVSNNALLIVDDSTSLTGSNWETTVLFYNQSATPTVYTQTNSADAYFALADTNRSAATLTVYNLNQTGRTRFTAISNYFYGFAHGGGIYDADTTSTTLTFKPSSGTLSGGNILCYGYNAG